MVRVLKAVSNWVEPIGVLSNSFIIVMGNCSVMLLGAKRQTYEKLKIV